MKDITFEQAKQIMFNKLGDAKIMALAACEGNHPTVRNISAIIYNDKIYFKTDNNFPKTKMLLANPQCALAWNGTQVEGTAKNLGLVVDEPGRVFEQKYKEFWWKSYNAYSHVDTEILIEVTPSFVEVWDEDEDRNAFQIYIDFDKQTAEYIPYD